MRGLIRNPFGQINKIILKTSHFQSFLNFTYIHAFSWILIGGESSFVSHETSCTTFFENHFEISKLGTLFQTFIRSLPVRILTRFFKKSEKKVLLKFQLFNNLQFAKAKKKKICFSPRSHRAAGRFVWNSLFTVIW